MNSKNNLFKDLPIGFSLALAQNSNALDCFSSMNSNKQQEVINGAKAVRSKEEMKSYVNNLKTF